MRRSDGYISASEELTFLICSACVSFYVEFHPELRLEPGGTFSKFLGGNLLALPLANEELHSTTNIYKKGNSHQLGDLISLSQESLTDKPVLNLTSVIQSITTTNRISNLLHQDAAESCSVVCSALVITPLINLLLQASDYDLALLPPAFQSKDMEMPTRYRGIALRWHAIIRYDRSMLSATYYRITILPCLFMWRQIHPFDID
jgi:hypothetical protein